MRSAVRLVVLLLLAAGAAPARAADLTISNAWFRSLPGGLPAGGYFSLANSGSAPLELTGAKSPACGMLMLHQSTENSGVSRMDDIRSLTVPAGGSITFAPGGYHLMCTNPTAAMTPGKSVPVRLLFSNGTHTDANFAVKNAAGN
jgi:copper(I)-binding protein